MFCIDFLWYLCVPVSIMQMEAQGTKNFLETSRWNAGTWRTWSVFSSVFLACELYTASHHRGLAMVLYGPDFSSSALPFHICSRRYSTTDVGWCREQPRRVPGPQTSCEEADIETRSLSTPAVSVSGQLSIDLPSFMTWSEINSWTSQHHLRLR